jgi:hypothetical protein
LIVEGKLKLKLHPHIHAYWDRFEFLGCLFKRNYIYPTSKSRKRLKEKVRYITRRQQPKKVKDIINRFNPVIRAWGNYFKQTNVKKLYRTLDEWTRMRLRSFLEKKKAVVHQNKRIYNWSLKSQGLVSLQELIPTSFPAKGQL